MNNLLSRLRLFAAEQLVRIKVQSSEHKLRKSGVNRAIEQTVDQVNPRLRAVSGYRKRLYPVVDAIMTYSDELAARVRGPVLVDRQSWAKNPTVNALFGSIDRLRRVLTGPEVRKYVKINQLGGDCFAVLASMPDVRNQLGMELVGEAVQRDVRQTTVGFSDHEVALVGADEAAVREQLAVIAREILVGIAVEDILERESRIVELEDRLRILRIKSRVVDTSSRGSAFITEGSNVHAREREKLQVRIAEVAQELSEARVGMVGLDEYLARLVEQLQEPERHLSLQEVACRLDRMNILRAGGDDTNSTEIGFQRVLRGGKPARVVQLIRFPRTELLEDSERLQELDRYLG